VSLKETGLNLEDRRSEKTCSHSTGKTTEGGKSSVSNDSGRGERRVGGEKMKLKNACRCKQYPVENSK